MKNKYLYYLMSLVFSFSDILFGVCYILILRSRGINIGQVTFLISLMGILGFLFDFPSGNISDKIGRKKSTGIGLLLWGVAASVFILSKGMPMYVISVILSSLGIALYSGSPQAWMVDRLQSLGLEKEKNRVFYKGSTYSMVLRLLGAVFGSFLVYQNLILPVVIMVLVLIVSGISILMVGEDNYGKPVSQNFFKDVILTAIDFLKNSNMRKILLVMLFSILPFNIFIVSWQLYLTESLGVSKGSIGIFLAIFLLSQSMAGMLLIRKKSQNSFQDLKYGIVISLIGIIFLNLSFLGESTTLKLVIFIIGVIIYEFGLGIEQTAGGAWIQDCLPNEKRASYFSAITALISLASFLFTNLIGYLIHWKGYGFPFLLAIAIYVVAYVYSRRVVIR